MPNTAPLKFFSFYIPSGSVSGDFFDVVELSDTAVGLFICDVMGHDVPGGPRHRHDAVAG